MQGVKLFVPPRRSVQPYLDEDGTQTLFNSTQTAFVDRVPTATKPVSSTAAGAERFVFKSGDQDVWMHAFGVGSDDEVFNVRVTGWTEMAFGAGISSVWIPKTQWEGVFTLSLLTGEAGHAVLGTSFRFADTVVESASAFYLVGSTEVYSPANDIDPALVRFPHFGAALLDIQVNMDDATSGGVVVAMG
jgi:hypothetical protein